MPKLSSLFDSILLSSTELKGVFYLSKAKYDLEPEEVSVLIERANTVNKELSISGFLFYEDSHFIQFIEGPTIQVDALLSRIFKDQRHEILFHLERTQVRKYFQYWSMRWIQTPASLEPVLLDYSISSYLLGGHEEEKKVSYIWKLLSNIEEYYSELKLKEAEIRHSLNLLEISVSLQEVAVYEWDLKEDKVTHFNEYWQKILELEPDNVLSQMMDRIHSSDRGKAFEIISDDPLEGDTSSHVFRFWNKSFENLIWIHNTSRVLQRDPEGKPIKILGAFRNITPSKENELRYRDLFNHMPIPFAHGRLIRDEDFNIVDWIYLNINPAMENLLMHPKEEVEGKLMSEVNPGLINESTDWLSILETTAYSGKKQSIELFSDTFQKHLKVDAFRPKEGEFAIALQDESPRILASKRFDLTIEMEKIALWEWIIPDDRVVNHNQYWQELYEFDNKNTSQQFYNRVHEEDAEASQESLTAHFEGKTSHFHQLYRLWKKDRSAYTWIKNTGTVIDRDSQGNPTRILGISRNVSDEKSAELELIASKDRFENLFQNLNANFVVIKLVRDEKGEPQDFIFTQINKHACRLMRVTEEEILGTSLSSYFPNIRDEFGWFDRFARTAISRESQEFTQYSGPLQAHLAMTLYSPNDEYVAAVFSDVSKQVRASKSLRIANTKLQLSLEIQKLGFYEWNIIEDRVENANEHWKNIFEFEEEEDTSEQFNKRIPKKDLDELWKDSQEKWLKDEPFTQVYSIWNKSFSKLIWIRSTSVVVGRSPDGKAARLLGVSKDITDEIQSKKEIQELLRKSEVANIYKNQFLSNMSHEIRTPLNGIIGFSDLLKNGDLSKEERTEFSNLIKESTDRLLHLIDDILDISKIEAGELSISKEPLDICSRFENLIRRFENIDLLKEKKEIQLILDIPEQLKGTIVNTDPTRLDQIIANLISNSIKFTNRGTITLGIRTIKQERLHFYVKDEGIGIPKEKIDRIFTRFEQAHSSFKVKSEGTGLGLAIVSGLVKLLEGTIHVESEEGSGTLFEIALPVTLNSTLPSLPDVRELPNQSKELEEERITVLIAEDELINIKYYQTLFKKADFNVHYARDGEEAVEFYLQHPEINVVLMDVRMPLMSGDEAAKEILKHDPKAKIIAQTAFAMQNEKHFLMSLGFKGYVSKPIAKEDLFELLESTHRSE